MPSKKLLVYAIPILATAFVIFGVNTANAQVVQQTEIPIRFTPPERTPSITVPSTPISVFVSNKAVVFFTISQRVSDFRPLYDSNIKQSIETKSNTIFDTRYASRTVFSKADITKVCDDQLCNRYQLYPKTVFQATAKLSEKQRADDADRFSKIQVKDITTWLKSIGATNIEWNVKNSTGRYEFRVN